MTISGNSVSHSFDASRLEVWNPSQILLLTVLGAATFLTRYTKDISSMEGQRAIKSIDKGSIHKITSGQVVIDLQTAVKELVENSLDAGSTSIEVRFKNYGLRSIEVIDNGTGIAEEYHDNIALKHYTSKLASFNDLTSIQTFGFRGEALSSLCALSESLAVATATEPPLGTYLEMETSGKVRKRSKVARQRGTTVTITNLFSPLPVRRKELERNLKREFSKALGLLNAYALGPCCNVGNGIKLTVTNQPDKGQKTTQLQTAGASSGRAALTTLWGSKSLENIVDLNITFEVERERTSLKRLKSLTNNDSTSIPVTVKGLISKFTISAGRNGTDRQFFYVNGRPCDLPKIQKAFNEVYRSFNANQSPFILADFIVPTESCDINVSPDKRTIFLQSENNLISSLKAALEEAFSPSRSTFDVSQAQGHATQSTLHLSSQSRGTTTDSATPSSVEESRPKNPFPSTTTKHSSSSSPVPSSPSTVRISSLLHGLLVASTTPSSSSPLQPLFLPDVEDVAPADASMDVDAGDVDGDVEEEEEEEEPAPVLDTSQASWNRRTSPVVSTPAERQSSSPVSLRPHVIDLAEEVPAAEEVGGDDEEAVGHTKSTRTLEDMVDDDDDIIPPPPRPSLPPISVLEPEKRGSPSVTGTSNPSYRDMKALPVGRRKEASRTATSKQAVGGRKIIQATLTQFARAGSRLPVRVVAEASEEEEEDEDGDDSEQMPEKEKQEAEVVDERLASSSRIITSDDSRMEQEAPSPSADHHPPEPVDLIEDGEDDIDDAHITPIFDPNRDVSTALRVEEPIARPEVIRIQSGGGGGDVSLRFDVSKVKRAWDRVGVQSAGDKEDASAAPKFDSAAGVTNTEDDAQAVDALSRVIEKQDFMGMDILGQFNLGFIITRRRKRLDMKSVEGGDAGVVMDDLFIVDQHAADEKYNFETLQANTKIKSQKLFKPQPLEVTAADELVALENMDVLRQNGFEVEVEERGEEYVAGSKLKLVAQPISKSTIFNMKDLEELINLMRDRPSGQMVRCSKARAMFAMRACRKSVMVGMPLKKNQMAQVVQHMGTMDLPWNCPHGRPTMRHLFDLTTYNSGRRKAVNWDDLQ